ncbi:BPTF-associated chromatin complex component 1 isoform X3 [Lycorma delicatula]|uniref:BPTF-associated chromatin complex component 1 isoform X3 n=1 Tax=Lycorma delicatula TaxID=130591 RepID=UPI003F51A989
MEPTVHRGSSLQSCQEPKNQVGEIFTAAGAAFNKLGELTLQLHPTADSPAGSQIRTTLKKKAYEDAGIPVRTMTTVQTSQPPQQGMLGKSAAEVTLNMLNASESEVDVEGLAEDVKLEFDGTTEEVTS